MSASCTQVLTASAPPSILSLLVCTLGSREAAPSLPFDSTLAAEEGASRGQGPRSTTHLGSSQARRGFPLPLGCLWLGSGRKESSSPQYGLLSIFHIGEFANLHGRHGSSMLIFESRARCGPRKDPENPDPPKIEATLILPCGLRFMRTPVAFPREGVES